MALTQEEFMDLDYDGKGEYLNDEVSKGRDYEEVLAEVGWTKKDAGMAGYCKVGNKVIASPSRGIIGGVSEGIRKHIID